MSVASAAHVDAPAPETIVEAVRALGGRATLGDLAAKLLVPTEVLRGAVLPALSLVGGNVAVDERGNLVFAVDRRRKLPDPAPWKRWLRGLGRGLEATFIALLSVALVAYFVAYVVLIVVVFFSAAQGGDCSCDCKCDGCDCCDCKCKRRRRHTSRDDVLKVAEAKRARARARQIRGVAAPKAGDVDRRRWRDALERLRPALGGARDPGLGFALERDQVTRVPKFARAVHAFVFGPPRPPTPRRAWERNLLGFVRAHAGRVTAADAALVTGLSLDRADRVLLDLAARYGGDVEVPGLDDGDDTNSTTSVVVIYTFDQLMVSAEVEGALLDWILARGGSATVAEVAAFANISAAEALGRLQALRSAANGSVTHGETTTFHFKADARREARDAADARAELRDFTYSWERLETSPAILGVPKGKRSWIVGFNILNIVVGTVLAIYYLMGGAPLLGWPYEHVVFAYVPWSFSLAVFVIPLVRLVIERLRDLGRRARNARRVVLLAVSDRVVVTPKVSARDLCVDLEFDPAFAPQVERHLAQLARELEGELDTAELARDPSAEVAWTFASLHTQWSDVRALRATVDARRFALAPIVYDTAEPMP